MTSNVIKVVDNLVLRRIDPVIILRKYLAGDYKKVTIPKNKTVISKTFTNINHAIGTDQTAKIYRYKDKQNSGQIILTTNHEQYQHFQDKDKTKAKPIAYCRWCRREIKGQPIGIPISMTVNNFTKDTIFHIEDTYDTYGCVMASLKNIYGCHSRSRDPMYMDTEQILHCMYHMLNPDKWGERIVEAKDWRLLDINGGPLTSEEYDKQNVTYSKIPNVILAPIKQQYVKLSVGT